MASYGELLGRLQGKYPRLRVVERESSPLIKIIYWCTLMPIWNRDWLSGYTSTFGQSVYMPGDIVDMGFGYIFLRGQEVHLDGWRRLGFLYFLLYILLPPYRAYREYLVHCRYIDGEGELMSGQVRDASLCFYSSLYCDIAYGYMFPFAELVYNNLYLYLLKKGYRLNDGETT